MAARIRNGGGGPTSPPARDSGAAAEEAPARRPRPGTGPAGEAAIEAGPTASSSLESLCAGLDGPQDGMGEAGGRTDGWGETLASFDGVPAYSNGSNPRYYERGTYGFMYQCVEYVNRYSAEANGTGNMAGTGNAIDYQGDSRRRFGYRWVANDGGAALPQAGDILVFDGGSFGHVAIATGGDEGGVGVIQQNTRSAKTTLGVSGREGDWTVKGFGHHRLLGWQTMSEEDAAASAARDAAPAATPTATAAKGSNAVTVQRGDSLWAIAARELGDGSRYTEIARLNGLSDPSRIVAGQVLKLPGNGGGTPAPARTKAPARPPAKAPSDRAATPPPAAGAKEATWTVRRGDTLWDIAARVLGDGGRYREIARLNGIADPSLLAPGQVLKLPA